VVLEFAGDILRQLGVIVDQQDIRPGQDRMKSMF
jgi:hypothetical protein